MNSNNIAIVGSGIVGALMAHKLTQRGHEVHLFEKGNDYPYPHRPQFTEQFHYLYDNPEWRLPQDLQAHTKSGYYQPDLENERRMRAGGSATAWAAITLRMRPQDFKLRTRFDFEADWPIDYDDLEPYYCEAERLIGVSGTDDDNPWAPPRSQPYPMPAFELGHEDLRFADQMNSVGIHVHTTPQARTRLPYGDREVCANFGACGFCPTGARYSPNYHLHKAIQTGRCHLHLNASVRRILADRNGARGLIWRDNDSAVDQEHPARAIVIACGTFESARLLLLSKNELFPDGLGNAGGQVGRNLTFHHCWGGGMYFDQPHYTGRFGGYTGQSCQFLDPETRGRHGGLKIECSPVDDWSYVVAAEGWPWGTQAVRSFQRKLTIRAFVMHCESTTSPEKYVKLSDQLDRFGDPLVHVHYLPGEFDIATHHYAESIFKQMVQGARPRSWRFVKVHAYGSASHHMGVCRMGRSPGDSVVDAWGRIHGLDNCYVIGGSNFVGSSALNPTLTIAALALRSTDRLLEDFQA